jgi:hypothetical protein
LGCLDVALNVNCCQTPPGLLLLLLLLLCHTRLSASGEVTSSQLLKGFQRVTTNLPDTALDNPAAPVGPLTQADMFWDTS